MSQQNPKICIIGAGMSGLLMGIRLKEAGIESFQIYEKGASAGGTWRENRYPGLCCDVPSFVYSYSFEPNLEWSRRFSPGREIWGYFKRVAKKYDLLPHITFNKEIASARYEGRQWYIEAKDGEKTVADILISAWGALHKKHYPEIEGLDSFEGAMFHSADWDDDLELTGKRIGVMGTGSTAVQMMAPLSKVASQVHMFQRTAQWIMPVGNKEYSPRERSLTRRLPILGKLTRMYYEQLFEIFSKGVVQDGWCRRKVTEGCRRYLASVKDPELRRKLTPDYDPMCKRLVISNDFYPTLMKEHVELVTEGIDHIEAKGIVTVDGKLRELDVLALATGFDAHAFGIEQVVGEDGVSLKQAWDDGRRAYRSVAFPGFPNFFMLIGPNSPVGNISLIDISETQTRYVMQCIRMFQKGKFAAIVPNAEATRKFHESLVGAMANTIWVTGCNSWYLGPDGVPITWPWTGKRFRKDLRKPNLAEFDLISA